MASPCYLAQPPLWTTPKYSEACELTQEFFFFFFNTFLLVKNQRKTKITFNQATCSTLEN